MEKTLGFTLKSLKYGDTSAILKVYTRDFGMKSFHVKGFFSGKKKKLKILQFPFVQAEFSFKQKKDAGMISLYQVQTFSTFNQMYQHPVKLLILQFLTEVVFTALKDDEPNLKLYDFIENQISIFNDKKTNYADFHLTFLLQLTAFLGFFPNTENAELPHFDLKEGNFSVQKNELFVLHQEDTNTWRKLMQQAFDIDSKNQFNQSTRKELLNILLEYYKLHLPGFREPKSLEILKEILS